MKRLFKVKVPASSGNLGVGFDVLGLSLNLYSEVQVRVLSSRPGRPIIRVQGEGENTVARDERNLVYRCIAFVFKKARRTMPRLELICLNRIPLARGLGSSSAAIVAGLVAGNHLLEEKFSRDQLLDWATELEGHADNVASALCGGVRGNLIDGENVISRSWPVPKFKCVVAVPTFSLSTQKARRVLPQRVPMKDVVSNLASLFLLDIAFEGEYSLLKSALNDRLHEPYRAKLIPGFYSVKKAALSAGAYGAALSGAGPSIVAFSDPSRVNRVGRAMVAAFARAGIKSAFMNLGIDKKGAHIL